ncbi:BTAD domain-containing putative transcriptional regulator [Streptomyces cyaneofuscatus]|uniref:AfsR/SARP family transcriptional regulator n=1 Tax=Streptomyces cyaneofuscatus TaxID=66883 RepID=UPI00380C1A28
MRCPGTDVIRSGKGWYSFDAQEARLDTDELAARSGRAHEARASAGPTIALALFRGERLVGLPGRYTNSVRRQLQEQWRTLRRGRLECLVLLGRSAEALEELAELTVSRPLDEGLLALRIRALYTSGRQGRYSTPSTSCAGVCARSTVRSRARNCAACTRRCCGRTTRSCCRRPAPRPLPRFPFRRRSTSCLAMWGRWWEGRWSWRCSAGLPRPGASRLSRWTERPASGKPGSASRPPASSLTSPAGCLSVDLRAHATGQPLSLREPWPGCSALWAGTATGSATRTNWLPRGARRPAACVWC